MRRARLIFDGSLGKRVDFRVAPDFGGGKAELQDGYIVLQYAIGLVNGTVDGGNNDGNTRVALNYEETSFEGGASKGDRPAEQLVVTRMQVAF